MVDWAARNLKVYNDSALELAQYFSGYGPRLDDIARGLALARAEAGARVVEIGCGDGRDAEGIVARVDSYQGFDPSTELLKLARDKVPRGSFVLADALSYDYPTELDVVFAFASLLHVNRTDLAIVFARVEQSLRPGGIFYVSLKERAEYIAETKTDQHGERMFYYYNPTILRQMAGTSLTVAYESRQIIGHTDWFTTAFKKL